MAVVRTSSPAATEAVGAELARTAQWGDVFGLSGDLGAGKTALARGFARELGFTGRVHSPTFALLNTYAGGRLTVYHLDLYRLHGPEDLPAAGLDEYLYRPDGVSLVEWIERSEAPGRVIPGIRHVHLRIVDDATREVTYDDARA